MNLTRLFHKPLQHPNAHPRWSQWSEDQTLHLILPYSNYCRWRSRRELIHNTLRHLEHNANVKVYVGELAYGDYPFEVTDARNPQHVQIRTAHSPLFHKENIINIVVKKALPANYLYGAYLDADLLTTRHDWALETIHLLHRHPWVQTFSAFAPLSPRHLGSDVYQSFAYRYKQNPQDLEGAPGGGWAWTKSAFDTVGGLFDQDIVGGGDSYMAFGLVSAWSQKIVDPYHHCALGGLGAGFENAVLEWQRKAQLLRATIGCTNQLLVHQFHGAYKERGYNRRHAIMRTFQYDPAIDSARDSQGLLYLTGNKPALARAIIDYLQSRNEDASSGTGHVGY